MCVLCACVSFWLPQVPTLAGSANTALALLRLGVALGAEGDHLRAGDVFARAAGINERVFGAESSQVAECMHGLGLAQVGQVYWRKTKETWSDALDYGDFF